MSCARTRCSTNPPLPPHATHGPEGLNTNMCRAWVASPLACGVWLPGRFPLVQMIHNTLTRTITGLAGGAAVAAAGLMLSAAPANAAPDSTWDELAQCESGGDWSINSGNGYSGGLQFSPSTWEAHGGSGAASDASRGEQIAVAERVLDSQGWGAWPSCSQQIGASGSADPAPAPAEAETREAPAQEESSQQSAGPEQQAPANGQDEAHEQNSYTEPQQAPAPSQSQPHAEAPAAPQTPAKPGAAEGSGEFYTVQTGDTLDSIAQAKGIDGGWTQLWAANLDQVSNPDTIEVGQELELPAV